MAGKDVVGAVKAAVRDPRQAYADVQEYLPAAAGMVGTAVGTPAVGALAAQGTDVARRAANVALGIDTPTDPLQVALGNVGQAVAAAPGKFIPKGVSGPVARVGEKIANATGKGVSRVLQSTTGVPQERFGQMFENPTAPIPIVSTIRRWASGKRVDDAIERAGFGGPKEAKEVFDPLLSQARRTATKAVDIAEGKFKGQEVPNLGKLMVEGKRAINRIIKGTSRKDRASIPEMIEKAKTVDKVLSGLSPSIKEAMSDYAEKAMASEFSNILPLVMSGNVSYLKSIIPAFAALGGAITPAGAVVGTISSPILMGSATAMAGVINKALKVPQIRNFLLSQAAQEATGE